MLAFPLLLHRPHGGSLPTRPDLVAQVTARAIAGPPLWWGFDREDATDASRLPLIRRTDTDHRYASPYRPSLFLAMKPSSSRKALSWKLNVYRT